MKNKNNFWQKLMKYFFLIIIIENFYKVLLNFLRKAHIIFIILDHDILKKKKNDIFTQWFWNEVFVLILDLIRRQSQF